MSLLSFIFLNSCNSKIDLGNFSSINWKTDAYACHGQRKFQFDLLKNYKENMYGLTENGVVEILGMPNKQNLNERNRKTYFYYLEPGDKCNDTIVVNKFMIVDFDALNRVKLISTLVTNQDNPL
ncbi:MAG: hypothetical protein SFY32_04130 [Bacteroidota bacterium]|nr:hypothetical protein [Bacteroidota bacterium]